MAQALDSDAIDHYREKGWVVLGPVLDEREVATLCGEEERFRLDQGFGAAANQNLRVNIQLCHRSAPIRRFCTTGPHIPLLQQLAGPNLCLTHQQFVTKLPDAEGERSDIPVHQDNGYGHIEPMTDITIWVPLVDTDETNGALQVVDGSHLAGLFPHDASGVNPVLVEAKSDAAPVCVPLRAGEGIAFTGLTLHGSGPNRSSSTRPAFYVRYCEPTARMMSADGRPVLEDPHSWMVAGEA